MSPEEQESVPAGGAPARVWLAACGVAALGLLLRLLRCTADELWPDEAFLAWVSGLPLRDILPLTWQENTPPLAHLLVAISERLFGPGEAAIRLPSLVGGSLLAPALYLAGRALFGERTGLFAGLLVALSPIHIFYSQIGRAYALLPLLALASAITLHHLAERPRRAAIPIHAVVAAAAIWLHQWGVLLLPLGYIYLLLRRTPGGARRLLASHGIAALLCLPLLPAVRPNPLQVDIVRSFYDKVWKRTPPALAIPKSLETLWAGGSYPAATTGKIWRGEIAARQEGTSASARVPRWFWRTVCWISLLGLLLFGLVPVREGPGERERRSGRRLLVALYLFVPLLLGWVFSLIFTPIYLVGRHDVIVLPFVALLAGRGAAKMRSQSAFAALGIYIVLAVTTLVPFYRVTYRESNRERASLLLEATRAGDVVIYTGYTQSAIEYYMRPGSLEARTLTMPITMGKWRAGIPSDSLEAEPGAIERDADRVVAEAVGARSPEGAIYVIPSAGKWIPALWPRLVEALGQPVGLPAGDGKILRFGPGEGPR